MNNTGLFMNFACSSRRWQPAVSAVTTVRCRLRLGKQNYAGFSLVEVIVSALIVGVMLVAALETAGAVFHTERQNANRLIGPNLAMELMTEVLARPFEDPEVDDTNLGNTEDGTISTRDDFDDVDDYDGWIEVGIRDRLGVSNTELTGWQRQVGINWVEPATGVVSNSYTPLKRITVTVTSPTGEQTQLSAYRAKDGTLERPEVEMTAVTWLGAKLQLGVNNDAATVGTNLTNFATDVE